MLIKLVKYFLKTTAKLEKYLLVNPLVCQVVVHMVLLYCTDMPASIYIHNNTV